jgi:hypothetical protein
VEPNLRLCVQNVVSPLVYKVRYWKKPRKEFFEDPLAVELYYMQVS